MVEGGCRNVSFRYEDILAGFDMDSLKYSIIQDGETIRRWTGPKDLSFDDKRFNFNITDLEEGDYDLQISCSDYVGNELGGHKSYYLTTVEIPDYDLALGDDYTISPSPMVEGYETTISVSIINYGIERTTPVILNIYLDGEHYKSLDISSMPSGAVREVRWSWIAQRSADKFHLVLDPTGSIPDQNRVNNELIIYADVEYLDLSLLEKVEYSNNNPENMERIRINFTLKSIGTMVSGPVMVRFFQDEKFQGDYHLKPIEPGESVKVNVDWKVDKTAKVLILIVDPYNEIYESVEHNNLLEIDNPFLIEEDQIKENDEEAVEDEPVKKIPNKDRSDEEETDEDIGGIIWDGPEDQYQRPDTENEKDILQPIPEPDNGEDNSYIPTGIPLAGMILSTFLVGAALFAGYKLEYIRYKLLLGLVPLYSKLKKKEIEKGVRFEIMGYLKAKPGANYTELKRNLDLNDGSLVHHLRILEREEKIYSKKVGKYKLFYVSSYRREPTIGDYLSPFQKRILEIVSKNPGIVNKNLARILDRSQTDISYHLSELARAGFLDKKKKGRHVHYYPI